MIRKSGSGEICFILGIVPLDVLWVQTVGWSTESYKQQNIAENLLRNPSGMFSPEDKRQ
jgi:hypothetical protein